MPVQNFDSLFSSAKHFFQQRKISQALEVLELAIKNATPDEVGKALEYLASIYSESHTADKEKALEFYVKSYEAYEKAGNNDDAIGILNKIALLYAAKKDYAKAVEYYEKCLDLIKKTKDIKKQMVVLKNLGKLYNVTKEYVKSLRCHQESLELKRTLGDMLGEAENLQYMGSTYENSGNTEIARDYYLDALDIYEKMNYKPGIEHINKVLDQLEDLEADLQELDEHSAYRSDFDSIDYDKDDFF